MLCSRAVYAEEAAFGRYSNDGQGARHTVVALKCALVSFASSQAAAVANEMCTLCALGRQQHQAFEPFMRHLIDG